MVNSVVKLASVQVTTQLVVCILRAVFHIVKTMLELVLHTTQNVMLLFLKNHLQVGH